MKRSMTARVAIAGLLIGSFARLAAAAGLTLGQTPLYLSSSVPPMVMLTVSKDHTLFNKAYNDYSDLDGDGVLDTTYNHGIDYAGYFDAYKCYTYDTSNNVFVPTNWTAKDKTQASSATANKTAKYCNTGTATTPAGAKATNTWSGNFLNWASMARIDVMRLVLYGGTRSTDSATSTILERTYLPNDAHSWAKYYNGSDINQLTPFTVGTTQPTAAAASGGSSIPSITSGSVSVTVNSASLTVRVGDQVKVQQNATPANFMVGTVLTVASTTQFTMQVVFGDFGGSGTPGSTWTVTDLSETGISICNTTVTATTYSQNVVTSSSPPLIRVAKGNFALWSANERWQCRWFEEKSNTNGGNTGYSNSNGNRAQQSQINASAENPSNSCSTTGLCVSGKTVPDYTARVQGCVGVVSGSNLNGEEKCKQYPGGNYKPVGLLQIYGDQNLIQFGLMTGSYDHNISGGVLRKNVGAFGPMPTPRPGTLPSNVEVNTDTDGTFTAASASGIVGNLDRLRQYGYNHTTGVYNDTSSVGGDSCSFQLVEIVSSGGNNTYTASSSGLTVNTANEGNCSSWGNPMSEMYLESLRYFAGKAQDPRFNGAGLNSTSKDVTLGLTAATWSDPVSLANYCAPMNVMMFNPAVSSYDDVTQDQMDKFSDLVVGTPAAPFNASMDALTKSVGDTEGITNGSFFIGNASGTTGTNADTCVPKTVTDLSQINGMCPEAPAINGSYRMIGAAWFAHMNRIRGTFTGGSSGSAPPTSDKLSLKVTTYGVQLATNTPKIIIPVPGGGTTLVDSPLSTTATTVNVLSTAQYASSGTITIDGEQLSYTGTTGTSFTGVTRGVGGTSTAQHFAGATIGQTVVIQPTYRLDKTSGGVARFGSGTLVDFKVVAQDLNAGTGTFYINYEDSGFGGDYDQDVWGRLSYCWKTPSTTCPAVNGTTPGNGTITVTQDIIAQSTALPQGWGFIISGTNQDGMHFFSGILGLNYPASPQPAATTPAAPNNGLGSVVLDSTNVVGCTNCQVNDPAKSWIFTLGPASARNLQDPLYYAAKWGGFTDLDGDGKPSTASEFDVKKSDGTAGADGVPDNYYFVTNPLALEQALDRAFIAILTTSSASSVATNTTKLQAGATVYQARFNSADWSGQLLAFSIDLAGNVNTTTPVWDASLLLPAWNARNIITYNQDKTSGTNDGLPFLYASLTNTSQKAALNTDASGSADPAGTLCSSMTSPTGCTLKGDLRLQYLRGNNTNEGAASGLFRVRPNTKLGDIVNSTPNFVGAPSEFFFDGAYLTFRAANANRKPVIYVGGNDGMLHAFDASSSGGNPGQELFAYVPGAVYSNLTKLTGQTYAHRYFVDGNPTVGSAFLDPSTGGSGTRTWNTVLVGSLNGGGQALYALNVTDPTTFTEANASSLVLWELTDKDDPDLGFTYSTPVIAKMANGKWAAIIGNGYNNSIAPLGSSEVPCLARTSLYVQTPAGCTASFDGHSFLFIVFLEGGTDGVWTAGTDYIKIDTGQGTAVTPAGLSSPFAVDYDGDDIIDYVYAGDLQGNLWKFDVTDPNPANWKIAFPAVGVFTNGSPLFTAKDASSNPQPIQDSPQVTVHPNGGLMVLFGTGKYLELGDDVAASSTPYRTQSFYAIWDQQTKTASGTTVSGRSQLMVQSIFCAGTSDPTKTCGFSPGGTNTNLFRITTKHLPNYSSTARTDSVVDPDVNATAPSSPVPANQRGWFIDFPNSADSLTPSWSNTGTGERVIFHPVLSSGKLVFATLIPSAVACELGGTGYIQDLDPITGSRLAASPLDVNGDGNLNASDLLSYTSGSTALVAVSAEKSTVGIPAAPTVIAGTGSGGGGGGGGSGSSAVCGVGCEIKVISGSSGQIATIRERAGAKGAARISWRELISD